MKFEKNIDNNTFLVSSVSDSDAAVLEALGCTHSSVNDREIDDKNGSKINCECWTKKEVEPKLGAFVLTTYYSFDSDMPVWVFATEEEARAELKRQFNEELRIQTEENERVLGEDLETDYTDEWDFASISTIEFENTKDVMEWKVSQVRTDKGIGSEIPVPATDGFMNPPVSDENEITKQIVELLDHNELSAGNISEVFRALHRQDNCIGGKIWSHDDIRSQLNDNYNVDLSNDAVAIAGCDRLKRELKFTTPKEMEAYLKNGDAYNPITETFVSRYKYEGHIIVYTDIDVKKARQLADKTYHASEKSWTSVIRPGDAIYDIWFDIAADNWIRDNFSKDGWVIADTDTFSNENTIFIHHAWDFNPVDWIVGISGSDMNDVEVKVVYGTTYQLKKQLISEIQNIIANGDPDDWDSGTKETDEIVVHDDGKLYAYICFKDCHFDLTATPISVAPRIMYY